MIFDSFSIVFATFVATIILTIYYYYKHSFTYFKRMNVPTLPPSIPFGNINLSFFRKYGQDLEEFYSVFKKRGNLIGGLYLFSMPVVIPIDPNVIKDILTKNFQYFNDRGMYCNEEKEFLTAHLGAVSGSAWKSLRSKISPIFSGCKIKAMFSTMIEKTKNLELKLEEFEKSSTPFECKDLAYKLTIDMFCSIFLGINCNSLNDPNEKFPEYAKKLLKTDFVNGARLTLIMAAPQFIDTFNLKFVRKDFTEFFVSNIKNVVEYREKNSIERQDFMNLLIRLKNNKNIDDGNKNVEGEDGLTMEQLMAQCFAFFLGGVDTSATTINYCLFELTQRQDIQDKLREEIRSVLKKHNGEVTYDAVMEMTFLDKVVLETLRKYPSVTVINRKCVNDYNIPGTNMKIENGTFVFVPVLGLHHDPEYYPDPDKFDPERFSEEEKAKRLPYTYLPFGEGPKMCVGFRFGVMQTKLGMIHFLKNYKLILNSKTKLPLEYRTEMVLLANNNGIWIDIEKVK